MEKKEIIIQVDIPIKDSEFTLSINKGFKVLSTGKNKKIFCLWISVNPDQPKEDTQFILVKNNEMIVSREKRQTIFVTTLQDGDFVGHLFKISQKSGSSEEQLSTPPEGSEHLPEKSSEILTKKDEDRESTD